MSARNSAMRISSAFASWDSGEDAAAGGFSSEMAAGGKANPAAVNAALKTRLNLPDEG